MIIIQIDGDNGAQFYSATKEQLASIAGLPIEEKCEAVERDAKPCSVHSTADEVDLAMVDDSSCYDPEDLEELEATIADLSL